MKEKRIALVIKTEGLEYDDRVRKEILTVQKLFPNITFKIFVMLSENKSYEGVTSYGIPFKSIFIPARDKYKSGQKELLKAYQFYKAVKQDVIDYDAVWSSNIDSTFIPLMLHHKRILWDLHELPLRFLGNCFKQKLLKYIFHRCQVVLHANPQREKYLEQVGVISKPQKHFALRNYPNFSDVDKEYDDKYAFFIKWKGDRKCVYLQGIDGDRRAAFESVSAVMRMHGFAGVVVGSFDETIKKRLHKEYSDELSKRIMFIGKIPQLKIPQYVKQCYTTLVFYKNINPNNYYCEANRFYQSVIMGLPVVVGNNPSMKELVNQYGLGVSIDDDGNDINKIVNGLNQVITHYDEYQQNNFKYRDKFLWDNQDEVMREIIGSLFE